MTINKPESIYFSGAWRFKNCYYIDIIKLYYTSLAILGQGDIKKVADPLPRLPFFTPNETTMKSKYGKFYENLLAYVEACQLNIELIAYQSKFKSLKQSISNISDETSYMKKAGKEGSEASDLGE